MSEVKIKNGQVAKSDAEKYRALAMSTGDVFTVPDVLQEAFKEANLVSKWVSKAKIASHGGHHPSNWIPYEISDEQRARFPKVSLGNVVGTFLERGDLILAVKPKELQDKHRKNIQARTNEQLEALHAEVDAKGKKILRDED